MFKNTVRILIHPFLWSSYSQAQILSSRELEVGK